MAEKQSREQVALSRFSVLVAQLESIVASAAHQPPEALFCFDLLSDLLTAIDEEPKQAVLLGQRKCEDALQSLLVLGACRPVRHFASVAMAKTISRGDVISVYSRASTLQGFLSDGKKGDPHQVAGAAQCLGQLYKRFGKRITSGLLETSLIVANLMKFREEFVRQEALILLQNSLDGSGGTAAFAAYSEAFRLITRVAVVDKSSVTRIAAARCLKVFAIIGGPGLGSVEIDIAASCCVKGLEDHVSSVRDAFAEALGAFLALGMNPLQPGGNGHPSRSKKLEGSLQKHLATPFRKASGARFRDVRIGVTLSWVSFLQVMRVKYLCQDSELQNYALHAIDLLSPDFPIDAMAIACVIYILRVGLIDQMAELSQRSFLTNSGNLLQSGDVNPSVSIAVLRSMAYTLETLGEVPLEFKDILDNTVVASLSHSSELVRIEASLTLRVLAQVDPACVGGLLSFGVTSLNALREAIAFEKTPIIEVDVHSLHGQANMLAALMTITPSLPLGCPARFFRSILQMAKQMITKGSNNSLALTIQKEAGWLLLASLLTSMPREELEDQVFDILSLWTPLFSGNVEYNNDDDSVFFTIRVFSASIGALTAFIRHFQLSDSPKKGILLQPVLVYLSSALSFISSMSSKEPPVIDSSLDILIIRTLIAYQSLPDPMAYKSDQPQLVHICATPFRDSTCEESSCLRQILDERDAWLGPWTPGRNRFEDELRYFSGEKSGMVPCVWEAKIASFPLPETIPKMTVNQMLLSFGLLLASQNNKGMRSLFSLIEECLKTGRRQPYRNAIITNICVGLLSGLKSVLSLRMFPLGLDILNSLKAIFLSILAEGGLCASQRRACAEGLGLLARFGSDTFTVNMTKMLLGELNGVTESPYSGSIALALGCIHKCAGGMALSSLVPPTVNLISALARNSFTDMQVWYLHSLVLTIEAAGFSYVSHVQEALGLALDVLIHDEDGQIILQQGIGRLVNSIVAVLGPEFSAGSIFFSRCRSIITEICSHGEAITLIENARFTQQLVLFAPQAVAVRTHLRTLIPTIYSGQPSLRHLAITTLGHLIEKDPTAFIDLGVEYHLFHMLDEETDSEIGNLVRTAILRLMYRSGPSCPSRWISICHDMVLATSVVTNDNVDDYVSNDASSSGTMYKKLNYTDDDVNMVSRTNGSARISCISNPPKDKHLRLKTRLFAAGCLSHLPFAVGEDRSQFDLLVATQKASNEFSIGNFLVLHLENLISLAYQISTIQFATMQPIGLVVLCTIVDKFETVEDPDLPGHLLLEQYQAQFVSAVRTALNASSSPQLLEAGLQLATKILTCRMISGDHAAVKRIFSLISRPLNDMKNLYYPSFAEWVSCKIKIRLLTAHASLKCYALTLTRNRDGVFPDEYIALAPLLSKISNILGSYWISILKDYFHICLNLNTKKNWMSFLDEVPSLQISSKLKPCLEEAWPVILHAVVLDAVPVNSNLDGAEPSPVDSASRSSLISGYPMVELAYEEYQFLFAFAMLVIYRRNSPLSAEETLDGGYSKNRAGNGSPKIVVKDSSYLMKMHETVLQVFQFLTTERFFISGFLNVDIAKEILKVLYFITSLKKNCCRISVSVLSQIAKISPENLFENEYFSDMALDTFLIDLLSYLDSKMQNDPDVKELDVLLTAAKTLFLRSGSKMHVRATLPILIAGYKLIEGTSDLLFLTNVNEFLQQIFSLYAEKSKLDDGFLDFKFVISICFGCVANLMKYCVECVQLGRLGRESDLQELLQVKLAYSLKHCFLLGKFVKGVMDINTTANSSSMFFTLFRTCINSFQIILNNGDTVVRSVSLQVLKSILQSTNEEINAFSLFFVGEIFSNPFSVIQMMMKEAANQESTIQVIECLRILLLLQSCSTTSESQRTYMKLLLEAVFMVLSAAGEGKLKSTAIRFVTQLAQLPSSAVCLKDAFGLLPPGHRKQLQNAISSSILQNQSSEENESARQQHTSKLKLPEPREKIEEVSSLSMTSLHSVTSDDIEEDEDWDTFQSFAVSSSHEEDLVSGDDVEKGEE